MKFDKTPIKAKTRKLKSNYSLEVGEDIIGSNTSETKRIERLKKLAEIDSSGITEKDLERAPTNHGVEVKHMAQFIQDEVDEAVLAKMMSKIQFDDD